VFPFRYYCHSVCVLPPHDEGDEHLWNNAEVSLAHTHQGGSTLVMSVAPRSSLFASGLGGHLTDQQADMLTSSAKAVIDPLSAVATTANIWPRLF